MYELIELDKPQVYVKKPIRVEALQYNAIKPLTATTWLVEQDVDYTYECDTLDCTGTTEGHTLSLLTLEGTMRVDDGDFIIKGIQGEFYPCKPDIFKATYDLVKE